jgi:putative hemolysin
MSVELIERDLLLESPAGLPLGLASSRDILGRIGSLETRIARSEREIDAAQAVRYRVFVEEMKAQVSAEDARRGREIDSWDTLCDHLLVLDRSIDGDAEDQIVGTYRLLRHEVAIAHGGFYSGSEFGVDALVARHPGKRFMELGRSCVLPQYRTKRTVELGPMRCRTASTPCSAAAPSPASSRRSMRSLSPSCTTTPSPRANGPWTHSPIYTARWI